MYEYYYESILKFLRDNDVKYAYEIKIDASYPIIKEALEEMNVIGYVTYASFYEVYLSNKGLAYLESVDRRRSEKVPTQTPNTYVSKSRIKTTIRKYKQDPWVINIVCGLLVLIIGTIILKYLKII